jgi:CubicO group peptidase (beta-lactamase class C family)
MKSLFVYLMLFSLVACGSSAGQPISAQLEALFRGASADGFNGSVLITRGDAVLFRGSFGTADEQAPLANTDDTRYLVMSVSKPLTAVLVFQQIEAGKLALDQRLDTVFANLSGKPAGAITIGQLLSHTSGIEEVISAHRDRRITPADLEGARVSSPGKASYSNTGFVCLALALEAVSGRSYAELIRERIFEPAGMHDSGVLRTGVDVPGLAMGYLSASGHREPQLLDVPPEVLDGAGSMYSTTGDLAKFDRALVAGKLLSADSQKLMYSRVSADGGYGWSLGEQGGKGFPWQKGAYRGYTSVFVRQIHRQEMIAILSNDHEADVLGLRTQVLRLLKADANHRE